MLAVLKIEETSRGMNKVYFLTSVRHKRRGFHALRLFAVEWFALRLRQCNPRKYTKKGNILSINGVKILLYYRHLDREAAFQQFL